MNSVAQIVFTGICAIIAASPGHDMAAVFLRAPQHRTYLLIERRAGLQTPVTVRPIELRSDESGKEYWIIGLGDDVGKLGDSIEIRGIQTTALTIANPPIQDDRKPGGTDFRSLHWVPHLSDVWPEAKNATVVPLIVSDHPSAARVTARMSIRKGQLSARQTTPAVWRVSPRSWWLKPYEIAMTQEVQLEVAVAGDDQLIIDLSDIETGNAKDSVTISGLKNLIDRPLEVLIGNTPDADILPKEPQESDCDNAQKAKCLFKDLKSPCTCIDTHFATYYNLFEKPPSKPPIPYRIEYFTPTVQPFRLGGANCGPSQLP